MPNRWDDTTWDAADFECDPTAYPGERELTLSPRSGGIKAHPSEKTEKKAAVSRMNLVMNAEGSLGTKRKGKLGSKSIIRPHETVKNRKF